LLVFYVKEKTTPTFFAPL